MPSRPRGEPPNALAPFLRLLLVLSLPFWLLGGLARVPVIDLPISALVAVVPGSAALILTHHTAGPSAAKSLLLRAVDRRSIPDKRWYLPALLLMPLLMALEYEVMRLAAMPVPDVRLPLALLPFIPIFLLLAIGEELGWQGYAADPLLARWPALTAALILGAIWAAWHLIPFLQTRGSLTWVLWQSVTTVGLRVLIVWLSLNTGRSLFAAVLFHTSVNVSTFAFPAFGSHYDPFIAALLIGITVAIVVGLWGPATLARFPPPPPR